MAKALPVHIDLMLIVGLKDEPHLNVQHVVAAYKRPTAAARQDRAIELWAFETAIIERCDTPNAIRREGAPDRLMKGPSRLRPQ